MTLSDFSWKGLGAKKSYNQEVNHQGPGGDLSWWPGRVGCSRGMAMGVSMAGVGDGAFFSISAHEIYLPLMTSGKHTKHLVDICRDSCP